MKKMMETFMKREEVVPVAYGPLTSIGKKRKFPESVTLDECTSPAFEPKRFHSDPESDLCTFIKSNDFTEGAPPFLNDDALLSLMAGPVLDDIDDLENVQPDMQSANGYPEEFAKLACRLTRSIGPSIW